MSNSSVLAKPAKPCEGYPLFAHATRRWAKKIRGRLHYFGPWSDPYGALAKYQEQRRDLYAGRTPRAVGDSLTTRELCNRFCTAKEEQVEGGELTRRTFTEYLASCKTIVDAFGKNRLVSDLAVEDWLT